jgi:glycosyltransferase 2 family protein
MTLDRAGAESDAPPVTADDVTADQLSLARRLRQPRTLISIALPLVVLVLIVVNLRGFRLDDLGQTLMRANPLLLVAAFVVYYVGFPLRGYRWALLLRGAGTRIPVRDSTEIVFISWLVNCVVPAKLGDVYRAYLLRVNFEASLSRTFGTVFIERVFDLFAIAVLGLAAGFWSFRSHVPEYVQFIFGVGVAVVALLAVGLFTLRNFGRRLITALPLPHRIVEFYDRFEEGVFSIETRRVPWLAAITAVIWATEAARLFLVIEALNFTGVHLGLSGAFFVALAASLLTAIPLTPAGLGVVEAGIVGILTLVYGVGVTDATAIALVDRSISVISVIVLGSVAYVLSSKTKAPARRVSA